MNEVIQLYGGSIRLFAFFYKYISPVSTENIDNIGLFVSLAPLKLDFYAGVREHGLNCTICEHSIMM